MITPETVIHDALGFIVLLHLKYMINEQRLRSSQGTSTWTTRDEVDRILVRAT